MPRVPILCLLALCSACTSVEWAERPSDLPAGWRDYTLFVSDAAFVLARDEDAAEEVHELVAATRTGLSEAHNVDPGRGLVLALSFEDPLPIPDAEEYGEALVAWRGRVLGRSGSSELDIGSKMQIGRDGKDLEIDPALPLHMVATPIDPGDPRLALPDELVERAKFVVLLPTATCVEECADAMIDIALEAEGISSFTYAAMTLIVGDPADMMAEKLLEHAQTTLRHTWMQALGIEFRPVTGDIDRNAKESR